MTRLGLAAAAFLAGEPGNRHEQAGQSEGRDQRGEDRNVRLRHS